MIIEPKITRRPRNRQTIGYHISWIDYKSYAGNANPEDFNTANTLVMDLPHIGDDDCIELDIEFAYTVSSGTQTLVWTFVDQNNAIIMQGRDAATSATSLNYYRCILKATITPQNLSGTLSDFKLSDNFKRGHIYCTRSAAVVNTTDFATLTVHGTTNMPNIDKSFEDLQRIGFRLDYLAGGNATFVDLGRMKITIFSPNWIGEN
jgi:hypothetical protein